MKDRFQPNFAEFPSHKTLRKENRRYLEWKKKYPGGRPVSDGYPLPDDAHKKDIFTKEKFVSIDKHALQVSFIARLHRFQIGFKIRNKCIYHCTNICFVLNTHT